MASNANERDTARPRFYMDAIQNMAKSEQENRPVYEEKEMIEIKIPGDKLFSWVGEVRDVDRNRWPEIYAAFKRGEARAATGTPLEHWPNPQLNKSRVAEIKAQNVLSVEELAGVPDNALPKLGMGARELREQAREYLARAKEGAKDSAMAARIAQLEQMVERLAGGTSPVVTGDAIIIGQELPQLQTKTLEDCTDAELKEYIKRETGESVRGNPSRETLIQRAKAVAEKQAA
jgi:hypothetical protein